MDRSGLARVLRMDTSGDVASWLSFVVTLAGLGGLIIQLSGISDRLDPFHSNRASAYLGLWHEYQVPAKWWQIARPAPRGPILTANMVKGFCGESVLHLSRLPRYEPAGRAGWAVIMAIIHWKPIGKTDQEDALDDGAAKQPGAVEAQVDRRCGKSSNVLANTEWQLLEMMPLTREGVHACVTISRTSLIIMLLLTNARPVFHYSDASGVRAGYASYNGQWYIDWPIGKPAVVHFAAHDSHNAATDVYPPSFTQRVRYCAQMAAGVISSPNPSQLQVAICGRKPAGQYVLEHVAKGFPGAHGARHLYNMLGGKVFEVDYIFARRLQDSDEKPDGVQLRLPGRDKGGTVTMIAPPKEQRIIEHALDCLPWNHMSWSIHRGLRDLLVTYAKPVMDHFRPQLAALLKKTVKDQPYLFDAAGWDPYFVRNSMGDMAFSAVLAGEGNSGDLVRVVTDVVRTLAKSWSIEQMDEVIFWRKPEGDRQLDEIGAVALTKVFVLEWSNEFDYQMYHDLPLQLMFG